MKTLKAVEYAYPHLSRYVVSYRSEVISSDKNRGELQGLAKELGFSHIAIDNNLGGIKTIRVN